VNNATVPEKASLKSGVKEKLKREKDSFMAFFPRDLAASIVKYTNAYAVKLRAQFNLQGVANYDDIDEDELMAFIGIMLLMGARGDNDKPARFLWNKEDGSPIYNTAMGRDRFCAILEMIRFDDFATSEERKKYDRFTLLR
jgi:Transposase IS4